MPNPVVHFEIVGPNADELMETTEIPGLVTLARFRDPGGHVVGLVRM